METEVQVYGAGPRFLLAKMEGRDQAGLVDPGSWTGESHDLPNGQVPGRAGPRTPGTEVLQA